MTAVIIDGSLVAERMRTQIAQDVAQFQLDHGFSPSLGVVLVGDDPASAQYVRMKRRACEAVGIGSVAHYLPSFATQAEVELIVAELNNNPMIHGILVQLPMPPHIDEESVLRLVSLDKDVDGLHPVNIGLLAMKGRDPVFTPATPTGCMILIHEVLPTVEGLNAVVLGRSNIVGTPMALMLMKANATVTVCHSRTKNLPEIIKQADILVAALGRPYFVQGDWLKAGATVIDVGTNRIDDADNQRGYRFVGDVDFESAVNVAGAITKVPGSVGPMTITLLMQNTLKAAQRLAQKN